MKLNKLLFLVIICSSFVATPQLASLSRSRPLAEGTISPVAAGVGAIGTIVEHPAESSNANPGSLASIERWGAGLNFVFGENLLGFQGLFFVPSSLGVLGISPIYIKGTSTDDLEQYFALQIGYAKQITNRLSFGFYFKPAYGFGAGGKFFGLGVDPALIYNTHSNINFAAGFGLYDFTIYAQTRNLALNLGNDNIAPRISLHLGLQSSVFQTQLFKASLYTETYGIGRFDTFPVLSGFSLHYWWLSLRIGGMFSQENEIFRGISFGTGLDIPFDSGNIAIHYAVLPPFEKRKEMLHFISINGSWGSIDREGPVVNLTPDVSAFSPDNNGKQDYVHFEIKVSDQSAIRDWQLEIKDSKGKVVRTFANDRRLIEESFGITDFFRTFFTGREALVVPRTIRWDGTGDPISLEQAGSEPKENPRTVLADAEYFYTMTATDVHGNVSRPVQGSVMLDTSAPQTKLFIENKVFSPNGDGSLDELQIDVQTTGAPNDTYIFNVENSNGQIIKTFSYKGSTAPAQLVWDGLDASGFEAPEGIYTVTAAANDDAGNQSTNRISGITLVRRVDIVELQVSADGFSPNGDGMFDTITIRPVVSTKSGLEFWEIYITRKPPEEGKPKPELVLEWSGVSGDSIPKELVWDGRDGGARPIIDGVYYLTMRTAYDSGNKPQSRTHPVTIDTTPPRAAVEADLNVFSPDGDGSDEEQIFRIDIQDTSPLLEYRLNIYETQYDDNDKKQRIPFKVFSGQETFPQKIFWDGKSDTGSLVESASTYEYELTAIDVYGNVAVTAPGRFETDILVLQTKHGLQIRLSAIEFDTGKASIKKKAIPVLQKLTRTLQRYPAYKIKIEGHTDSTGPEEINLRLSEERARVIMDYLISEGIDASRLSFQGKGEVYPLLPNTTWYNKSRNRRVEFLLLR